MIYKIAFVGDYAQKEAQNFRDEACEKYGNRAVLSISTQTVEGKDGRLYPSYEVELDRSLMASISFIDAAESLGEALKGAKL